VKKTQAAGYRASIVEGSSGALALAEDQF